MRGFGNLSYRLIFEKTIDALFIIDGASENVIDVNKAGCSLLGCSKEELIHHNLSELLGVNHVSRVPSSTPKTTLPPLEITNRTGRHIPVDVTVNAIDDNSAEYRVISLRDASSRVNYVNKLLSMNEELSNTAYRKDKLFSIIAHDLKNPMNSLMAISEFLYEENSKISRSEIIESSRKINNLSKNTYELLENLLEWTLLQTNKIEIQKEEIELNDLLDKVIRVLKPSADLKSITLCNMVAPGSTVCADKNMMHTIFRNLISNAVKYSGKNTEVCITAEGTPDFWKISVCDQGIGMKEELIKNLFSLNRKGSCYENNGEQRNGLGLALCNEFIKLHNGCMQIRSRVGEGSEFIIEIPKL